MTNQILYVESGKNEIIYNKLLKCGIVHRVSNKLQAIYHLNENKLINYIIVDITNDNIQDFLSLFKLTHKKNITKITLSSNVSDSNIKESFLKGTDYYFTKKCLLESEDQNFIQIFKKSKCHELQTFFKNIYITKNKELQSILHSLISNQVIDSQSILITGPSGIGKTTIAKHIHHYSLKSKGPFISVNLSEINQNIIESELFGHEKGSFTGATQKKIGLIERAENGTLFIDEIGCLSLSTQQKLLKVIDEKIYSPVGSSQYKKANINLISATCEDLGDKVKSNNFREDLYFRISDYLLNLPPLFKRKEDIQPLITKVIQDSNKKIHLCDQAIEALKNYSWYGNIRELKQVIQVLIKTSKGIVTINELPKNIINNHHPLDFKQSQQPEFINESLNSYILKYGLPKAIKKIEQEAFRKAQNKYRGKINAMAKNLNISKCVFYRIAKELSSECPT